MKRMAAAPQAEAGAVGQRAAMPPKSPALAQLLAEMVALCTVLPGHLAPNARSIADPRTD
jgi:hypothetical protein